MLTQLDILTDRDASRFVELVRRGRVPGMTAPAPNRAGRRAYSRAGAHPRNQGADLPLRIPVLAGGANSGAASGQGVASQPATQAVAVVPFDQASKRGCEPGPSWQITPGATETTLGPIGLPANGYLRAVEIQVSTVTAGTLGAGVAAADYPANIISVARIQDTNSAQLDDLPGYTLLQDNIYGGYAGCPDPRVDPDYSASATAPNIQLQVVRELAPTGFGCLANLSASQQYKLTLKIASVAEMYSTAPTTAPTLLISTWMHYWTLPAATDMLQRPQAQQPPFHGTAQYRWWSPANSVSQAFNLTITQVGNEIRNLILFGHRNSDGARSDAVYPDPLQLRWDSDLLLIIGMAQLRKIMRELTNDLTARDTGILALPFNFGEGRFVGGSGVNSWLPTVTATRLQITGTQPVSTPGTVDVFVNDVSVAETDPAGRPMTPSASNYHPPVAPQLAGAM